MRPLFLSVVTAALLAYPDLIWAQDTTVARPQSELAREADSIRAAYADSLDGTPAAGTSVSQPVDALRPPLEFRGHRLGDTLWLPACSRGDDETKKTCSDPDTRIGDAEVMILYLFTNDRLGMVLIGFESEAFDQLARGFAAKFGTPDSMWSTELQNRMGATFDNTTMRWSDSTTTLDLKRYGGSTDRGMATLVSEEELQAMVRNREKAAQQAKDDL